jgi:hypothetical protein
MACPDTSRLVDIVLEEGSAVFLGSSSRRSKEEGGAGADGGEEVSVEKGGAGALGCGFEWLIWTCWVMMTTPLPLRKQRTLLFLPSSFPCPSHHNTTTNQAGGLRRPSRPRRQTSALLCDTEAMDEICRKLGRGLPLTVGLSSGELAKWVTYGHCIALRCVALRCVWASCCRAVCDWLVGRDGCRMQHTTHHAHPHNPTDRINAHFRRRIRGMYLGNCVFTGEANDARLARAAQSYLRAFVHGGGGDGAGGGGKGREALGRLEREVAEINAARGVLPPGEEAALFARRGGRVVVEVESREEEEVVAVVMTGGGGGEVTTTMSTSVTTVTTTATTTTTVTVVGAEAAGRFGDGSGREGEEEDQREQQALGQAGVAEGMEAAVAEGEEEGGNPPEPSSAPFEH